MENRDRIVLVRPAQEWKEQALDYREEHFRQGESVINGSELLDRAESYEEWLAAVTANAAPETVDPNWVLTDTFFAVRERDRQIVGVIDLRHKLNDFLKDLGNCGYSVRPSQRGKGYASEMLRLVVEQAKAAEMKELHLSVERENVPSIKVIVKNGGVLERSFFFEGQEADCYRISLGTESADENPIEFSHRWE